VSEVNANFVAFVKDQLASLREVTVARFFGGVGVSSGGTQFAMIMGSALYFVVDDSTRSKYERMGSTCFSYSAKKKRINVRKYYEVPADVLEEQEQLVELAQESIRVANRSRQRPIGRLSRASPKRRAS